MMKVPTVEKAQKLLKEAESMNPGPWVNHNRHAGICAWKIADACSGMDPDTAYVLGLLHDIGRRYGKCDLMHTLNGYRFMMELGFEDSARICLTHSFPVPDIKLYSGNNDCSEDDYEFISLHLKNTEINDYDRLIMLCDAITTPGGPCIMEKRFVDVTLRYGFNDMTLTKWKLFLAMKEYFDNKTSKDIYELIGLP